MYSFLNKFIIIIIRCGNGDRMKKRLKEILYGFLFGISCLIPGFSGGTMLLILGIYENFTASLAKLSKKPIEAFKELWLYGIGTIIGIVIGTLTIAICLNYFPLIFASFFVGLVIATIPITLRKIRSERLKVADIVSYVIFLIIGLLMTYSDKFGISSITIETPTIGMILYIIVLATIASATMVIPAASGMTILLIFGMYDPLMLMLDKVFKGILKLNFVPLIENLWIILPFMVGILLGVIGISKMISKLLKQHSSIVWYAILGLLIVSPITIYREAYNKKAILIIDSIRSHLGLHIILCVVFLILGIFFITYLDYLQKKKQKRIVNEQIVK